MKKNLYLILLILTGLSCTQTQNEADSDSAGSEENSPVSQTPIIGEDKMEVLAEGFSWSEGPLWISEINALVFSDVPENKIYKWTESDGLSVYLEESGSEKTLDLKNERGSNGLALDAEGKLIITQHGNRQLAKMILPVTDPKPEYEVLSNEFGGNRFSSPNDLTIHSNGSIFFTDPPYGLYGQDDDELKEMEFNGVYRVNGDTTFLLIDSLTRPNGIALSPDEKTLYVANSDGEKAFWASYKLDGAGNVLSGGIFYDATPKVKAGAVGLPDGLKVHPDGSIYATGPGGVHVFDPQGQLLLIYKPNGFVSNCAFDTDHQWLYMTVDDRVLRVNVDQPDASVQ